VKNKLIIVIIAIVMVLPVSACSSRSDDPQQNDDTSNTTVDSTIPDSTMPDPDQYQEESDDNDPIPLESIISDIIADNSEIANEIIDEITRVLTDEPEEESDSIAPEQNLNSLILYDLSQFNNSSEIPDFLAFTSNGLMTTAESDYLVFYSELSISYYYGEWSAEVLQAYQDLLASMGFRLVSINDFSYIMQKDRTRVSVNGDSFGMGTLTIYISGLFPDELGMLFDERLVGKWEYNDGGTLELFADETGIDDLFADQLDITWWVHDSQLHIGYGDRGFRRAYQYTISGNELLLEVHGQTVLSKTLTRVGR